MLPQTRQSVDELKEAGLKRWQYRIKTPWKVSTKSYGNTTITVLCSYAQIAPYFQSLAKSFRVVVTVFDGVPTHVAIEVSEETGLYMAEHGHVEAVSEIVLDSCFEQLSLWSAL